MTEFNLSDKLFGKGLTQKATSHDIKEFIKLLKEEDGNSWYKFITGEINTEELRVEIINNKIKLAGPELI